LHDIFERGPDGASYIDGFIRFMSKGAQCRKAACQNAGLRIDQGAVEVQKNRAGHDPKIAAKGKPVQVPGILSGERLIQNVWKCG
jgi:hypothetical protein